MAIQTGIPGGYIDQTATISTGFPGGYLNQTGGRDQVITCTIAETAAISVATKRARAESFSLTETSALSFVSNTTISFAVTETSAITCAVIRARPVITAIHETSAITIAAVRNRGIIWEVDETSTITFDDTNYKQISFEVDETSDISFATRRFRRIIDAIHETSTISFAPVRARVDSFTVSETSTIVFATPTSRYVSWWFPAAEFDMDVGKQVTFEVDEAAVLSFGNASGTTKLLLFEVDATSSITVRTNKGLGFSVDETSNVAVNAPRRRLLGGFFVAENSFVHVTASKNFGFQVHEGSVIHAAVSRSRGNKKVNNTPVAFIVGETTRLVELVRRGRPVRETTSETSATTVRAGRNRGVIMAVDETSSLSLSANSSPAPAVSFSINETSAIAAAVKRAEHGLFAVNETSTISDVAKRARQVGMAITETSTIAVNPLVITGSSFTVAETSAVAPRGGRNRRVSYSVGEFTIIHERLGTPVRLPLTEHATFGFSPKTARVERFFDNETATVSMSLTKNSVAGPVALLPSKIVGHWWFGFAPAVTLAAVMSNAPQYNYASLGVLQSAQSGTGKVQFPQSVETQSQMIADIAAWKASGRAVVFLIGGQGDGGIALNSSTNATEFANSVIPLMDLYGVQGIDWDIETGAFSPNVMAQATNLVISHYGIDNVIIAASPRPFECRSGGIYRTTFPLMTKIDLICPQDYGLAGDSLAAQRSYMDGDMADFTANIAPASKWAIGGIDPAEGESIATDIATYNFYAGVYPTLRGSVMWTSDNDRINGYGFAIGMGTATNIQKTFAAAIGGTCTTNLHGYFTGAGAYRATTTGTLPAGLSLNTDYCVINLGDNTFQFATNRANALAGTFINLTSTGSGTHTLHG